MSCLCNLEIKSLLVALFENIFSHSVGCLFILFMVSFTLQKLFSLIRSNLFIFSFVSITLTDPKRYCCNLCQHVLPMFSFMSFIATSLIVRSLIHFECIFAYCIRKCSNFILLHVAVQCSQHHWKGFFPITYSCLCQKWGAHRCVGLSLDSLSCSIGLYFCFCASTIRSWWL